IIIGFDGPSDDPWVYYGAAVKKDCRTRLYKWRPRTGEQSIVVDEPAYAMPAGANAGVPWVHRYVLVRRPDGVATISASDFEEAYSLGKYTIRLRSPQTADGATGEVEREIIAPKEACSSPVVVPPDGSRVCLVKDVGAVSAYDLLTGEPLPPIRTSMPEMPGHKNFLFSSDGTLMFLPVHPNAVLVRNMKN